VCQDYIAVTPFHPLAVIHPQKLGDIMSKAGTFPPSLKLSSRDTLVLYTEMRSAAEKLGESWGNSIERNCDSLSALAAGALKEEVQARLTKLRPTEYFKTVVYLTQPDADRYEADVKARHSLSSCDLHSALTERSPACRSSSSVGAPRRARSLKLRSPSSVPFGRRTSTTSVSVRRPSAHTSGLAWPAHCC
jgi:hypothetical protein